MTAVVQCGAAFAQGPAAAGRGRGQGPVVVSPEVLPDHRVTFRILAPQAETVGLRGGDIPQLAGGGRGAPPNPGPTFTKGENGVWEATVGPINPGAYRYTFVVNGVPVMDPRNPSVSESNTNAWSLFYIPGADFMDEKNVPHGAVASVNYYSSALGKFRRMHVYTPPGYEASGSQKYPVFYLLHGAGDCDDSWTSVGRAGFILDNLIAEKKARPMIVVMPAGHTSQTQGFGRGAATAGGPPPRDEFSEDFVGDIMPYTEKNYRTMTDRAHRAIAGLSMGGLGAMAYAARHPGMFAAAASFSGVLDTTGDRAATRQLVGRNGEDPGALWGDPQRDKQVWDAHNPTALAGRLKDVRLYVSCGDGRPGSLDPPGATSDYEDALLDQARTFTERAKAAGARVTTDFYGAGTHTWPYWERALERALPMLRAAIGA